MNRLISIYIWKPTSLILLFFLIVQLLVISPLLIFLLILAKGTCFLAPDVFGSKGGLKKPTIKGRKVLLCVDPTSFQSVNWATRDFIVKNVDHLVVAHVVEPVELSQPPVDVIQFDGSSIDSKNFIIPQYISEFCHWLGRNQVSYDGIIMKSLRGCNVAETIIKLAQDLQVDCILASASERTGT